MGGPSEQDGLPPPVGEWIAAGSQVAGYLVEEQVGRGGMAVVYRAHDLRLDRTVALKVLAPVLVADEGFRLRFIRESRAAAAIDDPHIIPVYEAGEAVGVLFIAMRFVGAGDVRSLVRRSGPLTATRAAGIISPVASALDAAHAGGLVHRDVKPANMLLDARPGRPDHVYLSDFGLSKRALSSVGLTGSGLLLGTPDYLSPEQISGRAADGRSDQYALACAAFELLSGAPPFQRDHGMAVIWAHSAESPPALTSRRYGLPPAVDGVLTRALAKDPDGRYPTCQDFADALRAALEVPPYDTESGTSQDQRTTTRAPNPLTEMSRRVPGDVADTKLAAVVETDTETGTDSADADGERTASRRVPAGAGLPPLADTITAAGSPPTSPDPATSDVENGHHRVAEPFSAFPGEVSSATHPGDKRTGRRRRALSAVSALVLIGGVGSLMFLLTRAPSTSKPEPGTSHPIQAIHGRLNAVARGPGGAAWSVGSFLPSSQSAEQTLTLRWDGTSWIRVPSPNIGSDSLLAAVADGPGGTAWAVGAYSDSSGIYEHPLILRWDGTSWIRVPSPNIGSDSFLTAVTTGPGNSAWAAGYTCKPGCGSPAQTDQTLILRWDGTSWTRVPSPESGAQSALYGLSAASDGTAWAVGFSCASACGDISMTEQTLILRWDGTSWTRVPSPNPGASSYLHSVSAGPGSTAWSVGNSCTSNCGTSSEISQTLILRWDGTSWTRIPSPHPSPISYLNAVTVGSDGTAWTVGYACTSSCLSSSETDQALILRWDGTAWTRVPSPEPGSESALWQVSTGPIGDAWAVGYSCTSACSASSSRTMILRWDGTTWSAG